MTTTSFPTGFRVADRIVPNRIVPNRVGANRVGANRVGEGTGRLHLTVRGRRVLAALLLAPVAIGIGGFLVQAPAAIATSQAAAVEFEYVTVAQGQSLWQIAEDIAGDRDVRDVIADIVRLNQLSTERVEGGQRLALPLH